MRRHHLLPLILIPLLAGCGAGAESSKSAAESRPAAVPLGVVAQPAVIKDETDRKVVRTGTLDLTVTDLNTAADRASTIIEAAGGRIDSEDRSELGTGSAHLVLRIPPAVLERSLSQIAALGKETDRSVKAEDVTSTTVDVASRISTQRASVARIRALLARAQSLSEINQVEGELTSRESDLESLIARQQALSGQVELATVTLNLSGAAKPVAVVHVTAAKIGFTDGLSGGWTALTGAARVVAVIAGVLLPFSWLLLIAFGARVAWRRKRPVAA